MCGIAGYISLHTNEVTAQTLKKMTDIIAHRGPDGDGQWISENGVVGLAHRRLSIIDLSHEADQPMHYVDRYSIVFNGEIYNYIELKETLLIQGYTFKTQSDTEVLMALYDRDKENCLQWLDGMFAFVLYDKKENTCFCARDRFGEKPFFYSYEKGKKFLFGSEMKCLWEANIDKKVNNRMLYNYLSFGYIENPQDLSETFYEKCTRLPHSHYLKINCTTLEIRIEKYYDIAWQQENHSITLPQAKETFKELFYTSVSRRLRSDVAVGSSLSGGLDSSLVVSVIDDLKKGTNQVQKTFSAVFPGFAKDERKYMDYVIAKTKVEPHFVTPNDEDMLQDIEKLSWHQEEPYGSASIYVQYRVMQLAKENNVTVLLDGQGADEILAGYHSYYNAYFNELKIKDKKTHTYQLEKYIALHKNNSINSIAKKTIGSYVRKYIPSFETHLKNTRLAYQQIKSPVLHKDFYNTYKKDAFVPYQFDYKNLNQNLYNTCYEFGLQQLLRYADRNSMAHSREVRLPFLSHELINFLFTLPATFKINEGWTKWIMRETFDIMPKEIGWRVDKIGYEPPQKSWMENKKIKEKIIEGREKFVQHGFFNKNIIQTEVVAPDVNGSNQETWRHLMSFALINKI